MSNKKNMIECDNLVKIFKTDEIEVVALQGLDLIIEAGDIAGIIGKSGSGKSTLLNIIAGLDRPSAGSIKVDDKDLLKFDDHQLKTYNRETIGFVWQNSARNLIPYLTACQNVEVPMLITHKRNKRLRACELLDLVGLYGRHDSRLSELSGGEQQRVAIAIALANDPRLLLADEPTGSVDSKTANHIMEVFNDLNQKLGVTIIIVTHDRKITKMVNRVLSISDGMIGSEIITNKKDVTNILGQLTKQSIDDEFVVLDKKGRIKIPEDMLEELKVTGSNRLRIRKSDCGIEISNDVDV